MNSSIFVKEINKIYEKVYSINENLSPNESREFMRGFEDGIKEGLGSWLGKAAHGVKQAVHDVTGAYTKGKEMAQKAWTTVKEFADSVYAKIKQGITTAVDYIQSAPGKIKEYLTGVYQQVVDSLVSAYNSLKDKAVELKQAVVNIWTNIVNNIQTGITNLKASIAQKITNAQQWYETNKAAVEAQAKEAQTSTVQWLKDAGTKTLDILTKIGNGTLKAAKGVGYLAIFLIVAPIYGLIVGAQKLGQYAKEFVDAGVEKVGEVWKKEVADFQTEYNKPIKEKFKHIKSFESFKD